MKALEQAREFRRQTIFKASIQNSLGNFLSIIGSWAVIEGEVPSSFIAIVSVIAIISVALGVLGLSYKDSFSEKRKVISEKLYFILTYLSTLTIGLLLIHQAQVFGFLSTPHLAVWVFVVATFESFASFIYHKPKNFLIVYGLLHYPSTIWLFYHGGSVAYTLAFLTVAYTPMIFLRVKELKKLSDMTVDALSETKNKERQLKTFIDLLPMQVAWFNSNLECIVINDSMKNSKRGTDYLKGSSLDSFSGDNLDKEIIKFSKSEDKRYQVELLINENGNELYHLCFFDKHNFGNGNEIFMAILNIHEDKTLKEINEQSLRLANLGKMASGLSHEINNPLMISKGYARKIKRLYETGDFSNELVSKYIEKVERSHLRIAEVVKAMGKFQLVDGEKELSNHSLINIVNRTLNLTRESINYNGIALITKDVDRGLEYYCNQDEIQQILVTFIQNAVDILKELPEEHDKEIEIYTLINHTGISLCVSDTGNALAYSQESLFTPFHSTKPTSEGFGVSLSIAQYIATQYEAKIESSTKGGKTIFSLNLPFQEVLRKTV